MFWEVKHYCRIHIFLIWQYFRQLNADLKNRLYLSIGHLKILSHWVCWVLKLNVMYYSRCTVFINSHTFHKWLLYVMYFMNWLLLCGSKSLNLWSFQARFGFINSCPKLLGQMYTNWRQISKLLSNFGCLFTFGYYAWENCVQLLMSIGKLDQNL